MCTTTEKTHTVECMTCEHYELSVNKEAEALAGAQSVHADRGTSRRRRATVRVLREAGVYRARRASKTHPRLAMRTLGRMRPELVT